MTWLFFLLLLINIIAFSLYFYDKEASIWRTWRVKEAHLRAIAYIGSIGTFIAIKFLNHKTRKFSRDVEAIKMFALLQIVFFIGYFILR